MTKELILTGIFLIVAGSALAGVINSSTVDTHFLDHARATATQWAVEGQDGRSASTPTPEPQPTEASPARSAPPTQPAQPVRNRQDCEEIRGTDYLSPEERVWFLERCVAG